MIIKQIGQTIEQNGEVILVSKDLPPDCMVLFIEMEVWHKIKDSIVIDDNKNN